MNLEFIFFNVLFLLIWFKTEAFLEYSKLLGLTKLFRIDKFEKLKSEDFELTYHSFLKKHVASGKYSRFFFNLITCPICLMCWSCVPVLYLHGIGIYSLYVVSILFIYYLFSKVMR